MAYQLNLIFPCLDFAVQPLLQQIIQHGLELWFEFTALCQRVATVMDR